MKTDPLVLGLIRDAMRRAHKAADAVLARRPELSIEVDIGALPSPENWAVDSFPDINVLIYFPDDDAPEFVELRCVDPTAGMFGRLLRYIDKCERNEKGSDR